MGRTFEPGSAGQQSTTILRGASADAFDVLKYFLA
jgi:hypothetical protein